MSLKNRNKSFKCHLKWLHGLQLNDKNQFKNRKIPWKVFLGKIFEFIIESIENDNFKVLFFKDSDDFDFK